MNVICAKIRRNRIFAENRFFCKKKCTKKNSAPLRFIPEIKSGKPFTQEIVLGTCSDVCHYDEEVSNIKLILKVTKIDGTIARVEETLELE